MTTKKTSVKVELAGVHSRGMTVCDLRSVRPGAVKAIGAPADANALVALAADSRPLIDLVVDAVLTYR